MNVARFIGDFVCSRGEFIETNENGSFAAAGILGYFFGALSLTLFISMFKFPLGVFSFFTIFSAALFSNFLFSGAVHLFLGFFGKKGDCLKLFLLTGIGDFLWGFLIPLGFWSRLGIIGGVFSFFAVASVIMLFRSFAIKKIYGIGKLGAFISLSTNYLFLPAAVFIFIFYAFVLLLMAIF